MEAEYNARHTREILGPCRVLGEWVIDTHGAKILEPRGAPGEWGEPVKFTPLIVLDDRGVWPVFEVDELMQAETDWALWRPARELQGLPGAPEVIVTPMLPMPFNARELAAFMLDGAVGLMVVAFYGGWNNGPDPERLGKINRDSFARRAVIDAFAAYHLAQAVVGELDLSVHARWDAAHKAYWKSPNDKALLKEFDSTQAAWDTANQTWLNAMVRELLGVGVEIQSSVPATGTQPQAATPKPVSRAAAQDAAILAAIADAGHNPLELPANKPGKPGVSSAVRKALKGNSLFVGSTVFGKAWERLSKAGDIAYKT
jgi:hypothetical protein